MTVTYVKPFKPRITDMLKRSKRWTVDLDRNHSEAGDHKATRPEECPICLEAAELAYYGKHIRRMDKRNFYAMQYRGAIRWLRKSSVIKNP